ncbi:MAG: SDR family oxidoreductase [Actinobacteria bacterium]|nr:SDR family oxidoreductase [Actinomycetota bacterium]
MDLGLRGKIALVTGGSRGIGRAIALGLADEGCHVAITARTEGSLRDTAGEIERRGVRCLALALDMAVPSAPAEAVARAVEVLGGLDVLVNNVGGSKGDRSLEGSTDQQWSQTLDVNLWPAVRASRAAIPHLRARGGGAIIHITSIYGREAGGPPAYNAAKSALNSLATAMGRELAAQNIRVNAVAPGSVIFPGGGWERRQREDPEGIAAFIRRDLPMGRFGRPEEIASVVVFLASPCASLVTAACLNVDGGQSRSNI